MLGLQNTQKAFFVSLFEAEEMRHRLSSSKTKIERRKDTELIDIALACIFEDILKWFTKPFGRDASCPVISEETSQRSWFQTLWSKFAIFKRKPKAQTPPTRSKVLEPSRSQDSTIPPEKIDGEVFSSSVSPTSRSTAESPVNGLLSSQNSISQDTESVLVSEGNEAIVPVDTLGKEMLEKLEKERELLKQRFENKREKHKQRLLERKGEKHKQRRLEEHEKLLKKKKLRKKQRDLLKQRRLEKLESVTSCSAANPLDMYQSAVHTEQNALQPSTSDSHGGKSVSLDVNGAIGAGGSQTTSEWDAEELVADSEGNGAIEVEGSQTAQVSNQDFNSDLQGGKSDSLIQNSTSNLHPGKSVPVDGMGASGAGTTSQEIINEKKCFLELITAQIKKMSTSDRLKNRKELISKLK